MTRVGYVEGWTTVDKKPTKTYMFYEKGKRATEPLVLAEALRAYPDNKYEWVKR